MKRKSKRDTDSGRELAMYPPIKSFLEERADCKHLYADTPQDRQKIHLPRNLSERDPDVVGVSEVGEVHIAEGKSLTRRGHSFDECVSQAWSLKAWADYIYVFFPSHEWNLLPRDDVRRNESDLAEKGLGLLVVDKLGTVTEKLRPRKNQAVEKFAKDE